MVNISYLNKTIFPTFSEWFRKFVLPYFAFVFDICFYLFELKGNIYC